MVGRRTCDLGVAGSRPGRDDAAQQPRQVVYTRLPLSPSSIIWYQRKLGSEHSTGISRGAPIRITLSRSVR